METEPLATIDLPSNLDDPCSTSSFNDDHLLPEVGSKSPKMTSKDSVRGCIRKNLLMMLIMASVILGLAIGFGVRTAKPSVDVLKWIGLPGEVYLRLLKMMIVPLIIGSVILGTASMDAKSNGRITIVSFIFIFVTNMISTLLGIFAILIFTPGLSETSYDQSGPSSPIHTQDIFADLIRNIFPENMFEATFSQDQTKYDTEVKLMPDNTTVATVTKSVGKTGGANLLGLIFIATSLGMAVSRLHLRGKVFLEAVSGFTEAVLSCLHCFMWVTPLGVFSLILKSIAALDDVTTIMKELGLFIVAVTVALVVHQLVVMSLILFVLTRRNPLVHFIAISRAWLVGFVTASSAMALPDILTACEGPLGVDRRATRFAVPFSVTLNANGSAVYIASSCLFVANLTGNSPDAGTIATIGVLVTVTSLAIPSVPSASIVTIVMILATLDIPAEAIALLLSVEFLLDRIRTTNSVVSHSICAVVAWRLGLVPAYTSRESSRDPEQETSAEAEITVMVEK